MATAPAVSVVIPTKNRARFVARALDAVLGQRGVNVEAIVVDDGSDDDAPALIAERAGRDERVRVVRHEASEGVARARNDGIAVARADWVAFLDDDDLWSPDKLRLQLSVAVATGAGFVYGRVVEVDERLMPLRCMVLTDPVTLRHDLFGENAIPSPSVVLARTSIVRASGCFDEGLRVLADWDLWIRLAAETRAACCPDVVAAYVRHPGSMLTTERDRMTAEFSRMQEKHAGAATEAGAEFGDRFSVRFRARGLLDRDERWAAARAYLQYGISTRRPAYAARAAGALVSPALQGRAHQLSRRLVPSPEWLRPHPR